MELAHTYSTVLTLLYQGQVEGLNFHMQDGRWIIMPAITNSIVVNMGYFLQVIVVIIFFTKGNCTDNYLRCCLMD